jgi:catechol 2,3-dioxygenase-like lactoylglutathione lyase family enzyme
MTSVPAFRQVVIDTLGARASAEFYRELLGLTYRPGDEPPPADEPDPAGVDWLVLTRADGEPLLAFQQVERLVVPTWPDDAVPQQLHLDFAVSSRDELLAQHDRVLALGGSMLLDRFDDEVEPLRVYGDPSGHPFCIFVLPT